MPNSNWPQQDTLLLIVIVNYRTPKLTIDCLSSLAPEVQSLPGTKVVVVDNNSGDNSAAQIQSTMAAKFWENWVSLVSAEGNDGFACGNNLAIRPALEAAAPPRYILLLNPDTVVRPGAIEILVNFLNDNPEVGIAGSRLEDVDGTPQHSAFRFPTIWSELDSGLRLGIVSNLLKQWVIAPPVSDSACPTDWVSGACMIVRREVFEKVGLLDENYFMYYEEVDFCLQANRAGWSCWYVPESRVVHLVGQSSGVTNTKIVPQRRPQYWFDSRQRYFLKNYGWWYAVVADVLYLLGLIIWKGRKIIQKKSDLDSPYLLEDFWQNSILAKLKFNQSFIQLSHKLLEKISKIEKINLYQNSFRELCKQIREDWIAHGRDWTKPGFRALAVQRFGVWRMTIEPKIIRAPFSICYRALYRFIRNIYGIDLPYTVQLGRRVIIEHQSGIIIHGNSIIGDDSIIRQGVTLGNRYLERPLDAPKLGARVNVGAGAKILGNVTVGDDVNIGANAVVLSDIPAGHTAVGIPAKVFLAKLSQEPKQAADFT